jgi:calcium permeable stress-gated cation channel
MFLVARERMFVVGLRQAHLLTKSNASRLSSRIVLFLSVPIEAVREENLHRVFGPEARRSWTVSDLDQLESLVQDRNNKASALEAAEIAFARKANKKRLQHADKRSSTTRNGSYDGDQALSTEDGSRPRHKSPAFIGKEIDTIQELRTVLPEIVSMIQKVRETKKEQHRKHTTAMFVEYSSQLAAHLAFRQIQHHEPLRMQPRFVGVQPKEVLWANLTLHPSDRIFRGYLATAFIVTTIILWSIPIGVVAAISNINYLTDKVHFLQFINKLPGPILGFLTGFVPPYLMSTFVSYVPKFFLCECPYT